MTFFKQYLALMVRIKGRGMGAEELLKAFFNSRFLVSVMESRLLKQQVDDAMSLPVWPDVNDLVDKWTNILTTKEATRGFDRDNGVRLTTLPSTTMITLTMAGSSMLMEPNSTASPTSCATTAENWDTYIPAARNSLWYVTSVEISTTPSSMIEPRSELKL